MQITRTGRFLIAFFGLVGLAVLVVPPFVGGDPLLLTTTIPLGGIWVAVALFLLWFAFRQKRRAEREQRIFRAGIRGRATVVEASSSMTVNETPLMRLVVELEIPGRDPRRASRRIAMPVFSARRMQPGLVLPAYADPRDPGDFILVW